MLLDAMRAIEADGAAFVEAHPDLEVFRLRFGKALNYDFFEDWQGGLFSRADPRNGGPSLDIGACPAQLFTSDLWRLTVVPLTDLQSEPARSSRRSACAMRASVDARSSSSSTVRVFCPRAESGRVADFTTLIDGRYPPVPERRRGPQAAPPAAAAGRGLGRGWHRHLRLFLG
jgi:hypothetical protein